MPVLDALLEGFDPGEMRDAAGRWVRGATSPRHGTFRIGDRVTYETGSREAGGHGPVTFTRQPGVHEVVGFQRNGNLRVRHPENGTTVDVHHSHARRVPQGLPTSRRATLGKAQGDAAARTRAEILAKSPGAAKDLAKYNSIGQAARAGALPSQRDKTGRPTGRKYDSIGAAARAGALPSQQPGSAPPPLPANAPERRFDPVTVLGREGTAARERGASSLTTEHADTRDKLTNLPVGQTYGLHGPQGQVGHVQRTAQGWEVYGPRDAKPTVHKTPSSAAGHAIKIQRSAAQSPQAADRAKRGYAGEQEVRGMNARQSQRAEAEAERQLEIKARTASSSRERALAQTELERRRGARTPRPRIRESAPAVLGSLLEGHGR